MEKFRYTLPDGQDITLPRFENVPVGVIRKTRRLSDVDQVFTILEELIAPEDLERIDKLDRDGFNDLVKAWRAGSAVTLGESSASSS